MTIQRMCTALFALALACDAEPEEVKSAATPEVASPPRLAAPGPAEPRPARADAPVMPGAKQAFARTLELIEAHYVDRGIGEDVLYTGAIEGVLARLVQLEGHPINALLDPEGYDELLHGTKGSIVGVGVEIGLMADVVVVIRPIPGGPAEAAGLKAGDRILGIDGAPVKGLELADVVAKIRGEAGSAVDLFVQRETEEWHTKLTRASIAIPNVATKLLAGGLGYVSLRGFAETTPAELDAGLAALKAEGARALVLDLRDCPGGVFESALAVAGRFLAAGQTIVTLVERDGRRTTHAAEGSGSWAELPLAVLIGPGTASGAEIVADALKTHRRATLIGQRTLGKGTVEGVHELGGGWALKLSSSRFVGASGELLHGRGVAPQLPVALAEPAGLDALEGDPGVAAARTWLEGQAK